MEDSTVSENPVPIPHSVTNLNGEMFLFMYNDGDK